jgi:hypothetical protein
MRPKGKEHIRVGGQLAGTLAALDLVLADGTVAEFFGGGASCSIER